MGRWTLEEVRDGLVDPRGGPGWVEGPLGRSGPGQGTHGEVRGGSGDPRGGPGLVRGPTRRSVTGPGTLEVIWERSGTLWEVRDG